MKSNLTGLMPNHFHLMVLVNEVSLPLRSLGVSLRHTETEPKIKTFNASIGIMLMGYTKAINKQENRTGKLFREETKAECLNCPNGITPSFYTTEFKTQIQADCPERQYPQVCFEYIHQNPVKAGLVKTETDWEFSSAQDYAGMRNGLVVNKTVANEYIKIQNSSDDSKSSDELN
ncbi:MAG: REP-associated tyrosine transposase [Bacteroidales bacterium]|nr:REP-associated tyrosine transposase [Bacteroidales bacterium]